MKTLRKGAEFKRVPDSTRKHLKKIAGLVSTGWEFCDKSTWKRECRDSGTPATQETEGS